MISRRGVALTPMETRRDVIVRTAVLAAYGTRDQVREQLQAWDRAADIVTIALPPGMPWHNIEATLQAAAPAARQGVRPSRTGVILVGGPAGSGRGG